METETVAPSVQLLGRPHVQAAQRHAEGRANGIRERCRKVEGVSFIKPNLQGRRGGEGAFLNLNMWPLFLLLTKLRPRVRKRWCVCARVYKYALNVLRRFINSTVCLMPQVFTRLADSAMPQNAPSPASYALTSSKKEHLSEII